MSRLLRLLFLIVLKITSRLFFSFKVEWVGGKPRRPFHDIHLTVLLNHTNLFEPIFTGVCPVSFLKEIAFRGVLPGADLTMNRPLVGKFFKAMVPHAMTVTRRKDSTWTRFLSAIRPGSLVLIFPEGRMKRPTGLDKHGKPMTVRGGVTEVLKMIDSGNMLILYSGGLHHIQVPGQGFPNLFQRAKVRLETLSIAQYKKSMGFPDRAFKKNVIADLERRRDEHCVWRED